MFDKLILLSEGYAIFAGYAKDAMDYFSSLGLTPQIAMNPADFLLDLATGTTSDITIPPDLENVITQMDLIPPPCAAAAAIGEDYHAPPSSSSTTSPAITCNQIGLTMRDESRSTSPEDFQRDLVHKVWETCEGKSLFVEIISHSKNLMHVVFYGCPTFWQTRIPVIS